MRRLRIGYDFHGVLVEDAPAKQEAAKMLFDTDIPEHSLRREFAEAILGHTRYERVLAYVYESSLRLSRLPPMPHAPEVLTALRYSDDGSPGHEQVVITSSGELAFKAVIRWTKKYRSFLGPPVMLYSVGRQKSKGKLIQMLGLHVYIDNKLSTLRDIRNHFESEGLACPFLFLLDRPDNQDQDELNIAQRVRDLRDFQMFVNALAT